jgi:hypothetical protein
MSKSTKTKPKVEGGRNCCHRRSYNGSNGMSTATKTKFKTKITSLKEDTYNIGEAKFAAKFQKSTKNIALYVQRKYTDGASLAHDMKLMRATSIALPQPLNSGTSDSDMFIWKEEYKEAKKKKIVLEENNKKAFYLVYGQCLPKLIIKIKGSSLWEKADKDQDVVQLLIIIQGYCCKFYKHQQSTWGLVATKLWVATFYQKLGQSVINYVEEFKALVKVVKTYGSAYGNKPGLIKEQLRKDGVDESKLKDANYPFNMD